MTCCYLPRQGVGRVKDGRGKSRTCLFSTMRRRNEEVMIQICLSLHSASNANADRRHRKSTPASSLKHTENLKHALTPNQVPGLDFHPACPASWVGYVYVHLTLSRPSKNVRAACAPRYARDRLRGQPYRMFVLSYLRREGEGGTLSISHYLSVSHL